ncbi:unnamed protein product [Phaedon cochleariae]|uniref:DNA-3-methyladenine glycosylase n=1 Tax=Phaedon cochleariae TaxID=80249 RepID=A0A9N9SHB4_PHACE|nr:unnamed protein product [Phaedon cochleariae]
MFFYVCSNLNLSLKKVLYEMSSTINCRRLLKEDIEMSCEELALYLLGKIVVRKLEDGQLLKGRILETESYLGGEDKASHSYNGRRTQANEPMYMPVGTLYVYMTYGMYYCLNISSQEPGAAVLLRALEPFEGIETMRRFRAENNKRGTVITKTSLLCNGPSKLCIALNITKNAFNKVNVLDMRNEKLWFEDDPNFSVENLKIIRTSRVGIPSAAEWSKKPLRLYIMDNDCVSKRDKIAERMDNYSDMGV